MTEYEWLVEALADDLFKIALEAPGDFREMAEHLVAEGWRPS